MVPFNGIGNEFGVYQGVFVAGASPMWLIAHRGSYAVHGMTCEGTVVAMTPWHTADHSHGFMCVATGGAGIELRFLRLPQQTRLTLPLPVRWRNLAIQSKEAGALEGVTPHDIAWYPPAKLFFASMSRRMPLRPHLPPSGRDDPHAAFAYKLAGEAARKHGGETGFEIRKIDPKDLSAKEVHRMAPLEHVLALETVRLLVPASASEPEAMSWFVAVGAGVLVSEDWASHGCVQLLSVNKDRVESAPGEWADIWAVSKTYQREVSGPVTAVAASEGNLILAYGHNVEIHRWTGTKLQRCAIHKDCTRLVTSLSIIKSKFVLAGNVQRGMTFLHTLEKGGQLALLARDFAETDAVSVEFMLAHTALAFVHADALGNLATFNYAPPKVKGFDPEGVRLVPLGFFHVGHKVNALRRVQFRLDAAAAKLNDVAVVFGTSSGAFGYIAPLAGDSHASLRRLQAVLYCSLPHVAGLHPKTFRVAGIRGQQGLGANRPYGKPPPTDSILDGQLLWEFAMAPRRVQAQLAGSAGCSVADVLGRLAAHVASAAFY